MHEKKERKEALPSLSLFVSVRRSDAKLIKLLEILATLTAIENDAKKRKEKGGGKTHGVRKEGKEVTES